MGAGNQIGDVGATALAEALGSGKCAVTTLLLGGARLAPPLPPHSAAAGLPPAQARGGRCCAPVRCGGLLESAGACVCRKQSANFISTSTVLSIAETVHGRPPHLTPLQFRVLTWRASSWHCPTLSAGDCAYCVAYAHSARYGYSLVGTAVIVTDKAQGTPRPLCRRYHSSWCNVRV